MKSLELLVWYLQQGKMFLFCLLAFIVVGCLLGGISYFLKNTRWYSPIQKLASRVLLGTLGLLLLIIVLLPFCLIALELYVFFFATGVSN